MKTKLITLLILFLFLFAASCMKNEATKTGTVNNLSPFAKHFLGLSTSANATNAPSTASAINQSYQGTISGVDATGGGKPANDSTIISYPVDSC